MTTYYSSTRTDISSQVTLNSTGDKYTFTPVMPIDVKRWGFIADVLVDVGAGLTVAMDHRPTAGSDTGRVEVDTIVRTSDVAAGKGLVTEVVLPVSQVTAEDGSLRDVSGTGPFQVDPGEQLVFEVTDAADTAGTGLFFLEYYELPHNLDTRNTGNLTVVTS